MSSFNDYFACACFAVMSVTTGLGSFMAFSFGREHAAEERVHDQKLAKLRVGSEWHLAHHNRPVGCVVTEVAPSGFVTYLFLNDEGKPMSGGSFLTVDMFLRVYDAGKP